MENSFQLLLQDFVSTLFERGTEARRKCRELRKASTDSPFECGVAQGYYEVLAHLDGQAEAFGIPKAAIGLDKIDLDQLFN